MYIHQDTYNALISKELSEYLYKIPIHLKITIQTVNLLNAYYPKTKRIIKLFKKRIFWMKAIL